VEKIYRFLLIVLVLILLFSCVSHLPLTEKPSDESVIIGGIKPNDESYITKGDELCILHTSSWRRIELQNEHAWLKQITTELIDCESLNKKPS